MGALDDLARFARGVVFVVAAVGGGEGGVVRESVYTQEDIARHAREALKHLESLRHALHSTMGMATSAGRPDIADEMRFLMATLIRLDFERSLKGLT